MNIGVGEKYCYHCGRLLEGKKCRKGLCSKHYMQMLKYGEFLDNSPYCKNDPNEVVVYTDYAELILRDKSGYELNRTLIDIEDIDLVIKYRWSYHHSGYAVAKIDGVQVRLHRLVMNVTNPQDIVDHINHNTLDNRKENLRICTSAENGWNSKESTRNTSGCKGVNFDRSRNLWRARITYKGERYELGFFDSFEEAVIVRKNAEEKLYGEYRYNK